MVVLDPGHRYILNSLDGSSPQTLQFVKREGALYPGNVGHCPGTTIQEVLRALVERCAYVNAQRPCAETESVYQLLRSALLILEMRAAAKHGLTLSYASVGDFERAPTCANCGHVACEGHPRG